MATAKATGLVRWRIAVLLQVLLVGLLSAAVPSCDDEDEHTGVCSVGDNSSCPAGLECRHGADGNPVCLCSPTADTGCEDGLTCQNGPDGQPACFCSPVNHSGCEDGLACENVQNGNPACFPPVTLSGRVFDMTDDAAIEGAHVVARDANGAAASGVAVSDAAGEYTLEVPTPRTAAGVPVKHEIMLRADATGFVTFPTAPRVALPIDMAGATGDPLNLESSATDIGMLPLPSSSGLGTISGTVIADHPGGTLIVAGGASGTGGGATGIADWDGSYSVFNVRSGSVEVKGYKGGLQLDSVTAVVTAGAETTGVDLTATGEATAVVTGKVEIVNPGDGDETSVILVVDETFVEDAARGEMPAGLRAYPVTGAWEIGGVPAGRYVVLAAFENDFLVRDPDTSIGGTELVRITVGEADLDIAEGFKVTGALDVVSPDGEEVVSGTPTFIWGDDSSEDHYEVRVFDAFGVLVWEDTAIPGVSGSSEVTVDYGGPALESGMLYQFRAVSIKNNGTPIAITEDLRGVFLYQ